MFISTAEDEETLDLLFLWLKAWETISKLLRDYSSQCEQVLEL